MNLPPEPPTSDNYALWRKDIELWKKLTDTAVAKQGLALQYACRTNKKIHEGVLNIDSEQVDCAEGINNVLKVLDELHNMDQKETALQCFQEFEALRRKDDETVPDFITRFKASVNKTKKNGNTFSDDLLAFKLLKTSNLPDTDQRIIRASATEFTFAGVEKILRRTYADSTYDAVPIKVEPTYCVCKQKPQGHQHEEATTEEVVCYARNKPWNKQYQKTKPNQGTREESDSKQKKWGKNPTDKHGSITHCHICDSINHWAPDCPDKSSGKVNGALYHIVLFEDEEHDDISSLVHETLSCAVLDSGAVHSVCGQVWLDRYLQALPDEDLKKVMYAETSNVFVFGNGNRIKAHVSVVLPITLGNKNASLQADVVHNDIPMLLSRVAMKRAKTVLDTINDKVMMCGEEIKLITTSSGHYAVPICRNRAILEQDNARISLSSNHNMSRREIAQKLHRQFAHPPAERLICLINNSEYGNDGELKEEIKKTSNDCKICARYKVVPPRPVVDLPLSASFNQTVCMDIKFIRGKPILHIIDSLTRFSASSVLPSKDANAVIENIFKTWISIFGSPGMFLSDNSGDFANGDLKEIGEAFNVHVATTAAELPLANNICVRYNAVLGVMVEKILEDVDCSIAVAVAWANSAKNNLSSIHGFSPAQLVFGFNPMLPCVTTDRPPALSETAYSDIIEKNLKDMRVARAAHIKSESSERLRRELSNNIRSGDVKCVNGDLVNYKRSKDDRWHGPGTVIGQDGQFVLVRHQSTWSRVHPCRLHLYQNEEYDPIHQKPEACQGNVRDGSIEETTKSLDNVEGDEYEPTGYNLNQEIQLREDAAVNAEPQGRGLENESLVEQDNPVPAGVNGAKQSAVDLQETEEPADPVDLLNCDDAHQHIPEQNDGEDDWVTGKLVKRSGKVRRQCPNG